MYPVALAVEVPPAELTSTAANIEVLVEVVAVDIPVVLSMRTPSA